MWIVRKILVPARCCSCHDSGKAVALEHKGKFLPSGGAFGEIMTDLLPQGQDLKSKVEDTGLGGSTRREGQVKHGLRGVYFFLGLASVFLALFGVAVFLR
jgi:hypothetical protein